MGWSERAGGARPLYTQSGTQITDRSVNAHQYGDFLIAIFDEWVRQDVGQVYVQMFDAALGAWLGQPGSLKNRFILTPDGEPGLNYLCAGYKSFFNHVDQPMKIMAGLLRQRRSPAEIMATMAAEDEERLQQEFAKAGRNDPCPCRIGQKFKQCHGRQG